MTLAEKRARINVLKAELCIKFMMYKLKPDVSMQETINRALTLSALTLDLYSIMKTPTYPNGGVSIVGEKEKEIILKPNR